MPGRARRRIRKGASWRGENCLGSQCILHSLVSESCRRDRIWREMLVISVGELGFVKGVNTGKGVSRNVRATCFSIQVPAGPRMRIVESACSISTQSENSLDGLRTINLSLHFRDILTIHRFLANNRRTSIALQVLAPTSRIITSYHRVMQGVP